MGMPVTPVFLKGEVDRIRVSGYVDEFRAGKHLEQEGDASQV